VGEHRDLLAYLVRRLLENGANSSFVHQLADRRWAWSCCCASPLRLAPCRACRCRWRCTAPGRANSRGWTWPCRAARAAAGGGGHAAVPPVAEASAAPPTWPRRWRAAGRLRRLGARRWPSAPPCCAAPPSCWKPQMPRFCGLLVKEAGKTWATAVAEVREAVDFCRYYAQQAEPRSWQPIALPGPTGESNELRLHGRGVFVCISPWNFPLAIFAGQVVAALATGNTVAAKPAEQTPGVARQAVRCCTRRACRPTRCSCCTAPARRWAPALVAHPAWPACASPAAPRWPRSSSAALAAKDGPSCR
jgi:RHH-type proline utilization regulon transcriptional repressor/proline dehydrogenase/delta 1-pyrroline-5-carboxylate dehydrogenase